MVRLNPLFFSSEHPATAIIIAISRKPIGLDIENPEVRLNLNADINALLI